MWISVKNVNLLKLKSSADEDCFQCISWLRKKKRFKASFWNGWNALFQHFGSEIFFVFTLKLLSIYFFCCIMSYKYDTKSTQIEAWHLCLLKANCFELPERTLLFSFFLISSAENSDISWICSDWASGPISKSTGKWDFYPPQNVWGMNGLWHCPRCHTGLLSWETILLKWKYHITKPWEEGERHDLKMSTSMELCPLDNDLHKTAGI